MPDVGGMKIILVDCAPCTLTSRSVHARRAACLARLSGSELASHTLSFHGVWASTTAAVFLMISSQLA
eukprot:scaffold15702_cov66-Phaeocystis_antarctica.AAC.8